MLAFPTCSVMKMTPVDWCQTCVVFRDESTGAVSYHVVFARSIRFGSSALDMQVMFDDLAGRVDVARGMPAVDDIPCDYEMAKWLRLMFPETKDAGVA